MQRRIELVDLQAVDHQLGAALRDAVDRVARSGKFILGETVASFERALAAHCGVREAVGMACGTDAVLLSLVASGVGPGDAVVTSPLSFVSTAEAIVRAGAMPRFVDVDPHTLCLCPKELARFFGRCRRAADGTLRDEQGLAIRAVVPVHLYGRVAAMEEIGRLATEAGACVVHDAAQAIGARVGSTPLGTEAPACLSFFPTKNLGGWGDGGAVLTNDGELAARLRRLRLHGFDGSGSFDELGFNSRLDALQAAILEVKLAHLSELERRRRAHAARYHELLPQTAPHVRLLPPLCDGDVCHLFTVRSTNRDAVAQELDARGIGSGIYYPKLLCDHPAVARRLDASPPECPAARSATREVLSLPVHEHLADGDLDRVVAALAETC